MAPVLQDNLGREGDVEPHRAKGKWAQKAGARDMNPSSPEDAFEESSLGCRDPEVESCMFSGSPIKHFADDIHCLLKVQTMIWR
jgi:hypothetical protein